MSKMLSRDVEGHFDVELEFHHLEGCSVPMSKQVPEQPPVSSGRLCPISIADSRCLDDRGVQIFSRHVINQSYKAVVQDIFLHTVLILSSPHVLKSFSPRIV